MAVVFAASTKQRKSVSTSTREQKTWTTSAGKHQESTGIFDATRYMKFAKRREFLVKSCFEVCNLETVELND